MLIHESFQVKSIDTLFGSLKAFFLFKKFQKS